MSSLTHNERRNEEKSLGAKEGDSEYTHRALGNPKKDNEALSNSPYFKSGPTSDKNPFVISIIKEKDKLPYKLEHGSDIPGLANFKRKEKPPGVHGKHLSDDEPDDPDQDSSPQNNSKISSFSSENQVNENEISLGIKPMFKNIQNECFEGFKEKRNPGISFCQLKDGSSPPKSEDTVQESASNQKVLVESQENLIVFHKLSATGEKNDNSEGKIQNQGKEKELNGDHDHEEKKEASHCDNHGDEEPKRHAQAPEKNSESSEEYEFCQKDKEDSQKPNNEKGHDVSFREKLNIFIGEILDRSLALVNTMTSGFL